jgi:transposase
MRGATSEEGEESRRRLKPIDRKQLVLRPVDVERLVEDDHPARAIWELVGQLDLRQFYAPIKVVEGEAGRSATDPRLLISLWLYAYSRGVGSARELSRLCQYEPGCQWLTGLEVINHHTLSDFRVGHQAALDDLFTQLLGVLSAEGLVTLEQVMHDGTKVRANAGADTFRREERLRAHLEAARKQVEAMGDPRSEEVSKRVAAARQRAQREREQRLEQALAELEALRAAKADDEAKQQARASMTDPQARVMKQPDGGYAPSYNVQVSTDGAASAIIGVGVTQAGSDYRELEAAVERVEENVGTPQQMVVDGGFVSRENVLALHQKEVGLIGPLEEGRAQSAGQMQRRGVAAEFYPEAFTYDAATDTYTCPAGKTLGHSGKEKRIGQIIHHYRARGAECQACPFKQRCCPTAAAKGRTLSRRVDDPVVSAFVAKMQTDEAKAIYRRRGPVAEFSNLWIKSKLGLRQFRLRGLVKVGIEAVWACLTYNVQLWIRLRWRRQWAT